MSRCSVSSPSRQARSKAIAAAEELLGLCAARLASFKVPRQIVFVDDYPRTATGKIQRARLKERVAGA